MLLLLLYGGMGPLLLLRAADGCICACIAFGYEAVHMHVHVDLVVFLVGLLLLPQRA